VPEDQVGTDVSVERLLLHPASDTRLLPGLGLETKIIDGHVANSMREAPSLSVTVLDPHDDLLTSGIFAYNLNAELDDMPFRLVSVSRQEEDAIVLDFEHLIVAALRTHNEPRKFSRGDFTRAEAARALVREVKAMPIVFVSPDIHRRQPIRKADERKSASERKSNRDPGISESAEVKRPDGRAFTTAELGNAERALDVADSLKAGKKATLALAEACIVEGPFFRNPLGGDGSSSGILQLLAGHLGGSTSTHGGRRDIELVCKMFLQDGFTGVGGAIAVARAHPEWTAGQVAQAVQGSGFPKRYDAVKESAEAMIAAYKGGGESFGAAGSYYKRYEFTRGQAEKVETTWDCTGRWADEVRWRRFVAGKRTYYFVADEHLMRSKPRYLIDPTTTGLVGKPTFDLEVGRRTVVVRGRSVALPSECVVRVRIDRWAAPPGSVIELADYGPLNGRWLVDEVSRPLFDAEAEVHLRQPQKALAEPRSEEATRQAKSTNSNGGGGQTPASKSGSLVYPLSVKGKDLGGPAAHKARAFGNWQSDNAVDIGCPRGTSVFAVVEGTIVKLGGHWDGTGNSNPNGFNVTLRGGGNQWFYTHLRYRSPGLKVGDRVKAGQYLGGSGAANGIDHLHIGCEHGNPETLLGVVDGGGFVFKAGHQEKL